MCVIDQDQDGFKQELRQAMRPVEAPEGFAERVLRRMEQSPAQVLPMRARPVWRWAGGALAASLLVGAAGTWAEREHRRRQQEEAERQFAVAMQVTSHALEQSREQLSRAGFRLVD